MKIAIPAEDKRLDSPVCQAFGRTEYYAVIDIETGSCEFVVNPGASAQGGAGVKAAQAVVDSGAKAVITFHLGQNAADVLQPAGVKILKAVPGTVEQLRELYVEGKLGELTEIHAGYHHA